VGSSSCQGPATLRHGCVLGPYRSDPARPIPEGHSQAFTWAWVKPALSILLLATREQCCCSDALCILFTTSVQMLTATVCSCQKMARPSSSCLLLQVVISGDTTEVKNLDEKKRKSRWGDAVARS